MLRKEALQIYGINDALKQEGQHLSPESIPFAFKKATFMRLLQGPKNKRFSGIPLTATDIEHFKKINPRNLCTKLVRPFLFLPYIESVIFNQMSNEAYFSRPRMVLACFSIGWLRTLTDEVIIV